MKNRDYLGAVQKYEEIGFGSSSRVYLCDYLDTLFVYKQIFGQKQQEFSTDKIARVSEFYSDKDFVFPYAGIFEKPTDVYLKGYVMDYLYDYKGLDTIKNLGCAKKLEILNRARNLVEKLHDKYNCVHADICPWNFQYNSFCDDLKLIDFDTNIDLKLKDVNNLEYYNLSAYEYLKENGVDKDLDVFLLNLTAFSMFNNVAFNEVLEWIRRNNYGIFESNENIKKIFESYKDLSCKKTLKKEYVIDYM